MIGSLGLMRKCQPRVAQTNVFESCDSFLDGFKTFFILFIASEILLTELRLHAPKRPHVHTRFLALALGAKSNRSEAQPPPSRWHLHQDGGASQLPAIVIASSWTTARAAAGTGASVLPLQRGLRT